MVRFLGRKLLNSYSDRNHCWMIYGWFLTGDDLGETLDMRKYDANLLYINNKYINWTVGFSKVLTQYSNPLDPLRSPGHLQHRTLRYKGNITTKGTSIKLAKNENFNDLFYFQSHFLFKSVHGNDLREISSDGTDWKIMQQNMIAKELQASDD